MAFVTGLAGVYILIAGIISDLFSWCQLIRIAGLFRIVAAKFRNLDKFQKESEFRKELIKVVNLQEIAYRLVFETLCSSSCSIISVTEAPGSLMSFWVNSNYICTEHAFVLFA